MSESEEDPEEKVGPTVRYLQKLGSSHLQLIFTSSRWIFEADRAAGLEVRCSLPFDPVGVLTFVATRFLLQILRRWKLSRDMLQWNI